MSKLNDEATATLERTAQIIARAEITVNGATVTAVADVIRDLHGMIGGLQSGELEVVSFPEKDSEPSRTE